MQEYFVGPCHVLFGDPTVAGGAGMVHIGDTRDDVIWTPNVNVTFGRSDQKGMAPVGDAYSQGPRPVATVPLLDESKDKIASYFPDAEQFSEAIAAEAAPAAWSAGTDYVVGDKVTQGGSQYIANRNHTAVAGDVADGAPDQANATGWDDYTLAPARNITAIGVGAGWRKLTAKSLCLLPQAQVGEGTNGIYAPRQIWIPSAVANGVGGWGFTLADGDDAFNRRETLFTAIRVTEDQGANAIPRAAQLSIIGSPVAVGLPWSLPAITN